MRIAVLDDYQSVAASSADWEPLTRQGHELRFLHEPLTSTDDLVATLQDIDIVVAMRERTRFDAQRLSALPNLRLLVTTGRANAAIDVQAARKNSITVCNTDSPASATVELTWALILATLRHIPEETRAVEDGRWQSTIGADLAGSTLGIIGLGRIGSQVARVGQAFGMNVIAWSQNLTEERARAEGVQKMGKPELLRTSDVLSVHYKLSSRSRGLIGTDDLALVKPSAILINTSRGPVVESQALVAALQEHRLAGAGLDVYEHEPLPLDDPLRAAPNTVLSPHLGYVTRNTYATFYGQAVEDIVAWLQGSPIRVIS
jgi:phosphoglycerate dehydrogenase-like enzyme